MEQTGGLCYVCECAIAVVAIEDVLAVVGDEDGLMAVVVLIGNGDALRPALTDEAGFFGDVCKRAVAVVFVEAIRCVRGDRRGVEAAAVENENVEPAVVIVIEECNAAAGGFEDIVGAVSAAEDDGMGEAGLRGDISELREPGNAGSFGTGTWA